MRVAAVAARPRPLVESDVRAASALLVSAYPHRWHEPQSWAIRRRPNDAARWVVDAPPSVRPGWSRPPRSLSAYLAIWRVEAMQCRMDLIVDPACRHRGAGGALLDFLIMQARLGNATSLQARPYGNQPDALGLLDARGFRETMRMIGLELGDVRSAALGTLADTRRALDGRELRITTLAAQLESHPGSWAKLHGVHQAAQFGWPDPDPRPDGRPHEPETVEEFRTRCEENGAIRDACFIATTGDRFVGYSMLTTTDPGGVQAGSGGTAVRPEYRGLGVATALKACCVAWARDTGVRRLVTSSGNPAMVRVNEKLGFRRTYTEVRLVKRFPADAAVGSEDR